MSNTDNIYLDNNSTTRVDEEVFEAMVPFLKDVFGNPSSVHAHGQQAKNALELARMQVAALLKADPSEIIFTSGGTEANNLAILGSLGFSRDKVVVVGATEHHSVLKPFLYFKKEGFIELHKAKVDEEGVVDLDALEELIRAKKPSFLTIMAANNETGTLQPLEKIAGFCQKAGVLFHTDVVAAAGKISLDVESVPVSMMSLSAHKIYGPKGVGALFVRRGVRLNPLFWGGHQENRKRPGTENLASIVGFGKACELANKRIDADYAKISGLRTYLEEGLLKMKGVKIYSQNSARLPGTVYVHCPGVEAETMVVAMDLLGISVSSGSACTSEAKTPSHVLAAMGVLESEVRNSIRFSIGRTNTLDDILAALAAFRKNIKTLGSCA